MPCRIAFGPDRTEAIRNHQRRAEAYAALSAMQTAPLPRPSVKAAKPAGAKFFSPKIMPVAAGRKEPRSLVEDQRSAHHIPSPTDGGHAQTGGV